MTQENITQTTEEEKIVLIRKIIEYFRSQQQGRQFEGFRLDASASESGIEVTIGYPMDSPDGELDMERILNQLTPERFGIILRERANQTAKAVCVYVPRVH